MAYLSRSKASNRAGKELKKVQERVAEGARFREQANYDATWSKLIKMYGNMFEYPELSMYDDVVAPNMVFSTVNTIVPSITVNYPKITVTPRKEELASAASTVEAAANYYWRHGEVHEEFRAATKDFAIIGHGWVKTTWEFEEVEVEMTPQEWQEAATEKLAERNFARQRALALGEPDTFPSDAEVMNSVPTMKRVVKKDAPLVERISPFDVFVDPTVTRLKDARWIAQRIFVPIEVARKNQAWDSEARRNLGAVQMKRDKVDVKRDGESDPQGADYAVVWEYYDLVDGVMCVFGENCDHWLVAPEDIDLPFDHPFVFVPNYAIPEKFYPLGDVEVIAPLQQELATTRTQMINDRKRYRRMYMVREDEIGEAGMDQILSNDDNVILKVQGDRSFGDIFAAVDTKSLPPEFYNQTAMILDDIDQVSGVFEYQRGGQTEISRTATEAAMIQDASNARSADKLASIELAISRVARNVVRLAQKNLTTEQVARIVDENGAQQWVPFDAATLEGEYDFEVEAGSTQPQNETFRRQSALQLMDTMAPFIQAGVVDPRRLAEHVLKNGFGIKSPEQFLIQMPAGMPGDPMAGQMGVSGAVQPAISPQMG